MDECALIIACLLIGLSILRTRVFGIDVYPSHTLLQRSLTVFLAGLYLLIVGILAKLVTFLGGADSLPANPSSSSFRSFFLPSSWLRTAFGIACSCS